MEILGIIPVRKNSRGIPLKNIQKINGLSLVEHTIRTAKKSTKISRLILSTDSNEIAKIAKKLKVEVPFLRPKKYSKNNSPTSDVILHALDYLKRKESYEPDIITILQVTSPLRQSSSIDKAIRLLVNSDASSILGVSQMKQNPFIAFTLGSNKFLKPHMKNFQKFFQRQKFPKFYYPSGSIYTFWKKTLEDHGNIYGPKIKPLIVSKEEGIDIDDVLDLFISENVLKNWNNYKKNFLKKGVKL